MTTKAMSGNPMITSMNRPKTGCGSNHRRLPKPESRKAHPGYDPAKISMMVSWCLLWRRAQCVCNGMMKTSMKTSIRITGDYKQGTSRLTHTAVSVVKHPGSEREVTAKCTAGKRHPGK